MDLVSLQIRAAFDGADALLRGSGGMRELARESAAAEAAVRQLDQAAARVEGFERLSADLASTGTALAAARARVAELQGALAGASGPAAQRLGRDLRSATDEVTGLERAQARLQDRANRTAAALQQAGVDTQNLAAAKAALAGRTAQARAALDQHARALQRAATAQAQLSQAQQTYERQLAAMGNLTWVSNGALDLSRAMDQAGFGLQSVTGKAIAFESAVADMAKVVNTTPAGLATLTAELRGMTRQLPLAASELARIAAAGGQLGIVAGELPKFTDIAAKMAVAFDMTADAAGKSIAKMSNVFGLTLEQTRALGDAINVLGNNTAANAAQIVDATTRIGGTARNFGLAADEAAALATAMVALGKEPEVAATALNALLAKLQTANAQSKDFRAALVDMGMGADQLAAAIQQNPVKALDAFLRKLRDLDAQSRSEALVRLFGMEYQAQIGAFVNSLDDYAKALALVNDKQAVAGSMQDEFAKQAETTANKLKLLQNAVDDIAIGFGETLLPPIQSVATALSQASAEFPTFTNYAAGAALSLAGLGLAAGTVGKGVAAVGGLLSAANLGLARWTVGANAAAAGTTALNTAAAASAARLPLLTLGLQGAAAAAVALGSYKLGEALGEWVFGIDETTAASRELADSQALLTERLAEVSQQTGQTFATMDEFNRAVRNGTIEMGEWTGQWRAVSPEVQRLRQQLADLRAGVDQVATAAGTLPEYLRAAMASLASRIPGFQAPVSMIKQALADLQIDAGQAATGVRTAFAGLADSFQIVAMQSNELTAAVDLGALSLAKSVKTDDEKALAIQRLRAAWDAGRLSADGLTTAIDALEHATDSAARGLSRAEVGAWQFAGTLEQLQQRSAEAKTFWENWAVSNSIETLYRDGQLTAAEYLVEQDKVLSRMRELREEGRGAGKAIGDELRNAADAATLLNGELQATKRNLAEVRTASVDMEAMVQKYGTDVGRYLREQFGSAVDSRVLAWYQDQYRAMLKETQSGGGRGATGAPTGTAGMVTTARYRLADGAGREVEVSGDRAVADRVLTALGNAAAVAR